MSGSELLGLFLVAVGVTVTVFLVVDARKTTLLRRQHPDLARRSQYFIIGLTWLIWALPELVFGTTLLIPGGREWSKEVICSLMPTFQAC